MAEAVGTSFDYLCLHLLVSRCSIHLLGFADLQRPQSHLAALRSSFGSALPQGCLQLGSGACLSGSCFDEIALWQG